MSYRLVPKLEGSIQCSVYFICNVSFVLPLAFFILAHLRSSCPKLPFVKMVTYSQFVPNKLTFPVHPYCHYICVEYCYFCHCL